MSHTTYVGAEAKNDIKIQLMTSEYNQKSNI